MTGYSASKLLVGAVVRVPVIDANRPQSLCHPPHVCTPAATEGPKAVMKSLLVSA